MDVLEIAVCYRNDHPFPSVASVLPLWKALAGLVLARPSFGMTMTNTLQDLFLRDAAQPLSKLRYSVLTAVPPFTLIMYLS